jgi:hypothetical protein
MRIPIRLPTREGLLARAFKHFTVQARDTSGPAIKQMSLEKDGTNAAAQAVSVNRITPVVVGPDFSAGRSRVMAVGRLRAEN